MSPRFPQELFDLIIDYARYDGEDLKSYSTVCKRWTARSHSNLFERVFFRELTILDRWCKGIPPTIDGPSRYVQSLYICSGVIPLVLEPQSLDPYLDHFSALTRVDDLTLHNHRGKVHLDLLFQCFSAFKDTLDCLGLKSNSFRFEEVSRIVEFFPNLRVLVLSTPDSSRSADEKEAFQPPRRTSFSHLQRLVFRSYSNSPPLDHHLLSGLAEASMDLQALSVVGEVPDPSVVQKIVDSSAQSLVELEMSPLELDLSTCDNIQDIEVQNLLHIYNGLSKLHDSLNKPRFEHLLTTIRSPTLSTITISVKNNYFNRRDDEYYDEPRELLPKNDWSGVDVLLCDLLARIRGRAKDPLWTFEMAIKRFRFYNPQGVKEFLPNFQAMGGIVLVLE